MKPLLAEGEVLVVYGTPSGRAHKQMTPAAASKFAHDFTNIVRESAISFSELTEHCQFASWSDGQGNFIEMTWKRKEQVTA